MFLSFFYLLRAGGLKVSLNEWMTLMEALNLGMARSSLTSFYYLCRSILVKTEADYDKFDQIFAEYFEGIESPEELPQEFWDWLSDGELERDINDRAYTEDMLHDFDEIMKMFEERLKEQKEKHHGGSYWVGTGGTSTMGRGGYNPAGIRVGGEGRHRSAVQIAGERNFRDFREDNVLDIRQFQMAFRKLRQYSSRIDAAKTELDIDETIDETCENAGLLTLAYEKPRKNTVKVLLLMDSDGSMAAYSQICSMLFQSMRKSNHFKDLQVYYFHNCIYDHLYTTPRCRAGEWVETEWVMRKLDSEYKVIFVGDASMSPYELLQRGGNIYYGLYNEKPGITWFEELDRMFKKKIWLNPIKEERWERAYGSRTIAMIRKVFPMYELTIGGLEKGIKKLLVR
ncbi:MAG: VWA domain-containing protein [Eubacterium sp.]|nr:VWA domain-containing protein [Eubacterium sp.]